MANTEHILVLDRLEPFLSAIQEQTSDVGGDSFQLGLLDAVLFLDLLLAEFPKISVSNGEENDPPTQQGWPLLAALKINHSQIEQIHAQHSIIPINASQLQVLFNIPATCHSLDLKIQQDQYLTLHAQYLLEGVLPSTGLVVMPQFRDLDFFVLRGHEHRGYSQQLVPASRDWLPKAVFVDNEDCEVESMGIVAESLMDFHDPSHQRFSHGGCQFGLARHEVLWDVGLVLKVKSMGVYLLEVRLHLGQRLQPLGREGGLSGFLLGLFEGLGRGEVGEIEAEGA